MLNKETPVIKIVNLKKAFNKEPVLKGIDLCLYERENLVVLGKSGTGKSVLIKLIAGLLQADSGSISVLGKEITELNGKGINEMRKQIGFLFQSGALYDSMSVMENLEFQLKRLKKLLTKEERRNKIHEVLENVGLIGALHKMPSELSGGMRKRIALARTLVVDPLIMLYDEPTTGLDPTTSNEISSLILSVQEKYKTSSIVITHDMACARKVANRLIMMQDGKVYMEGELSSFENSIDELIQSFFKIIN